MKCLKLIFCLLYLCCSLAEAKEVQVDAQKEVDEMTVRLVASYFCLLYTSPSPRDA